MQKEGFKICLDLKRNLYRPIQKTEDISHRMANFTYDTEEKLLTFLIPRLLYLIIAVGFWGAQLT